MFRSIQSYADISKLLNFSSLLHSEVMKMEVIGTRAWTRKPGIPYPEQKSHPVSRPKDLFFSGFVRDTRLSGATTL